MNLPILTTRQAMTHLNRGKTVIALDLDKNTYVKMSHKTHELDLITLKSLEKKFNIEFYLDCPVEYSEFNKKYSIKQIVHMLGMLLLVFAMVFYMVYLTYPTEHAARLSKDNCLFLALSLSLIGCYHAVCFIDLIEEQNDEYIEKFLK